MKRGTPSDPFSSLLQKLLARRSGEQIFVFGPEGRPFWSAFPPTATDINKLDAGLRLLEHLEETHPKPFFDFDHQNNLIVAALDEREDLYFVVLESIFPDAAAARVQLFREDLLQHAPQFRREILRAANS